MRINDVEYPNRTVFSIRRQDGRPFPANVRLSDEVAFRTDSELDVFLIARGESCAVSGIGTADQEALVKLCDRARPALFWVVGCRPPHGDAGVLDVEAVQLAIARYLAEPLIIGVDTDQVKQLDKLSHGQKGMPGDQLLQWLSDQVHLPPLPERERKRFLISSDNGVGSEIPLSFQIFGEQIVVLCEQDDERKIQVQKVQMRRKRTLPVSTSLIEGDAKFVVRDAKRQYIQVALRESTERSNSYLGRWSDYAKLEQEKRIKAAQEFGAVRFRSWRTCASSVAWDFSLDENVKVNELLDKFDSANHGQRYEISVDLPSHLQNNPAESTPSPYGQLEFERVDRQRSVIVLNPMNGNERAKKPPESGFLSVSLRGDKESAKRRFNAYASLMNATCGIPDLGLLLDGGPTARRAVQFMG